MENKDKYQELLENEIRCCKSRKADKRFVDDYDTWIKCLEVRKEKLNAK